MADCRKCTRTDIKCCYTCDRNSEECSVWHKCGEDCPKHIKAIQTNAQRIRNMTDEELAKFIRATSCCSSYGADCGYPFCHSMNGNLCNGIKNNTDIKVLNWLKTEIEV